MRKIIASILMSAMVLPLAACHKESDYSLKKIELTADQRSWSCPDEKYGELLSSYEGKKCSGTFVVATDEDVVYLYCEDAYERDGTTLVSQDTIFDIASESKTFTAVAILQLAEKGKLDINDTLDVYFPDYEAGKNITIYNLLHMTSGIPDYLNDPYSFWGLEDEEEIESITVDILNDVTTDEDLLQALYEAPLYFDPGTDFSYSNTNYRLLALIIEQVSGKSYSDYVQKNIFDKCGMDNTTSMATGDMTYVPIDYEYMVEAGYTDENGYPVCPNNTRGDGGIHSSLTDMLAFDRALFGGKLINDDSMQTMLNDEFGYCCGLKKDGDVYSHDGSSLTCSSDNKIMPSDEFGHIYVLRFEHMGTSETYSGEGPLSGTGYTKGVFENGVYTNEYAGLTVNIPEGCTALSDSECASVNNSLLLDITDPDDYTRESSGMIDASFWDGRYSICYEFNYVNTSLGFPEDDSCSAEEFMDAEVQFYTELNSDMSVTVSDAESVILCGNEYLRCTVEMDDNGDIGYMYFYVRKLDNDLMVFIVVSSWSGTALEDLENAFV